MNSRIPQLDGVRGIAILAVILHNLRVFSVWPFSLISDYGWAGVDLFFVLSGFLITRILLDSRGGDPHYFRNFYARRCLRIWPLYYGVLILMFVVVPIVRPGEIADIFQKSGPWWSYPIFLQNFLVADPTKAVGPLGVTWSLAVEELFYLVWPILVRVLSKTQLRIGALLVIAASPVLRFVLSARHTIIYSNPFCRLDGIMAGALIALTLDDLEGWKERILPAAWAGLLVGAPLAIAAEVWVGQWLTFTFTILFSASLVFLGLFSSQRWLKAILSNGMLRFTGVISYGLYLLHKLPHDLIKAKFPEMNPWLGNGAAILAAYLVAYLSWICFEKPILKLKRYFEADRRGTGTRLTVPSPSV